MILFQRALVESQPFRDGRDGLFLPDDTFAEVGLHRGEAVGRIAEDHVPRNTRFLADHIDNVLGPDDQSLAAR